MRTLPDPFGIPGPSFMPSLSARTIPKFYPPDFRPAYDTDPNPSGRRLAPCAHQPNGKEHPRVAASRPAGHSPPDGKTVSFGLPGGQTPKFYHNPPGRTIPNYGRLKFCRFTVCFYNGIHRNRLLRTQKEVEERCRPDASTTIPPQHIRGVNGRDALPRVRSPPYISIPHTEVAWAWSAMYPRRPRRGTSERGRSQRVTTEGGDGRTDTDDNMKTHVNVDPINCVLPTNAPHTALPCVACGPGATAPRPHAIWLFCAISRTGP